MSHSRPIARHCIPQKQTHQIAMTALRSAAPANGGLGPDRIGRAPSLAMAANSASTSSTNTSTSANASHGPGDVFAGRTAVPMLWPRWALVHKGSSGRVSPRLRGSTDPDRRRHAEAGHAIQNVAADLRLGPLIGQSPGLKTPADDGL